MVPTASWHAEELLAFDLETTGVDRIRDVPVSFALVWVRAGDVVSLEAAIIDPGRVIPPGASAVHGITTERARRDGIPLSTAVIKIARAVVGASRRDVPIVGMKLDYDLTMLDACYRRETGRGIEDDGFHGPALDALVLDRHFDRYRRGRRTLADLCGHYGVTIEHAHDAVADAKAAVDVVVAMCRRYPDLCASSPAQLHVAQVGWHSEWLASFSEWRMRKGLDPLDDHDAQWPIAVGGASTAEPVASVAS